jgi:hypothetical protein
LIDDLLRLRLRTITITNFAPLDNRWDDNNKVSQYRQTKIQQVMKKREDLGEGGRDRSWAEQNIQAVSQLLVFAIMFII